MFFKVVILLVVVGLVFGCLLYDVVFKYQKIQIGWEISYMVIGIVEVVVVVVIVKISSFIFKVKGKVFDCIVIVYFENENYEKVFGDCKFMVFKNLVEY